MGSIYEATDPEGYRVAAKRLLDERHAARFEIEGGCSAGCTTRAWSRCTAWSTTPAAAT